MAVSSTDMNAELCPCYSLPESLTSAHFCSFFLPLDTVGSMASITQLW